MNKKFFKNNSYTFFSMMIKHLKYIISQGEFQNLEKFITKISLEPIFYFNKFRKISNILS